MPSEKITLFIADDHTIVRTALASLLSLAEDFRVIGEASDGRTTVEEVISLKPDVVLLDINMPELNGLEAARRIRAKAPRTKVLILSAHDNEQYVVQVIQCGAQGYLLKDGAPGDLYTAIRAVHAGKTYFSSSIPPSVIEQTRKSGALSPSVLTAREREILQLVVEGHTHQEIADRLFISVRTVDTHCNNIMKKLDIHDGPGLLTYAMKNGIVGLPR
jgi:DNA-binding NarL/FixJ family response regulator